MRLPWGTLDLFTRIGHCGTAQVLACLSFEERCLKVATALSQARLLAGKPHFLEVRDPTDAYPDYSKVISKRIVKNWKGLKNSGVQATRHPCDLLATEDEISEILQSWVERSTADVLVLDISSFPKRYFCFFLKQLLREERVRNLVVTYTEAGGAGYSSAHLCDDPMPCDFLPGYLAPLPPSSEWLVVSVGYEALNIPSLILPYRETTRKVKFLLAFPPSVHTNQRQWTTLFEIAKETGPDHLKREDVEVVSLWDVEDVYRKLQRWAEERVAELRVRPPKVATEPTSISLAPFGPKPHSLAMALFAIKNRCGMYYTQPKSYNPDYSSGAGESWFYAVKWDGIACFERVAAVA
jgi:hypothetical protein